MGRGLRMGLFFTAIAVFIPRASSAGASQAPAVHVVVHDSASVAESTLAEARAFSAAVFQASGIAIDSAAGTSTCVVGATFCVQVLLRPHHPQFEPGKVRTMGLALAADAHRGVVSVYLDAVVDVARKYGQ